MQNDSILDSTAILSEKPLPRRRKNFFKPTNQKETRCPPPPRQSKKGRKASQPTLTPPRLPASPAAQYELTNPPKLPSPHRMN